MCNYVTGFSLQSRWENRHESLARISSPLLSTFTVGFESEDDNRGSGR
jgi:hypothetical protein